MISSLLSIASILIVNLNTAKPCCSHGHIDVSKEDKTAYWGKKTFCSHAKIILFFSSAVIFSCFH